MQNDRNRGNHKNDFGCPVQGTLNVLSGKWKVLVVWHLSFGPRRFAELRDLLAGVSEKVLTTQAPPARSRRCDSTQNKTHESATGHLFTYGRRRPAYPDDDRNVPLGRAAPRHSAEPADDSAGGIGIAKAASCIVRG